MHQSSFKKVIIFIIFLTSVGSISYAALIDELRANVSDLSNKIESLDKEIAAFNKKISQTQGEAKTLKQALASLELRRAVLLKEIDRTRLKITETTRNIDKTEGKINETKQKINTDHKSLGEILRTIGINEQSAPPLLGVLAKNGSLSNLLNEVKQNTDLTNKLNARVRNLHEAKEDLSEAKTIYEEHKKSLLDLTNNLSDQKNLVEETANDKNKLLKETKNKEKEYQELLAERKKKKDQLESELSDVEAKLKVAVDASKLPPSGKGVLKYPVDNVIVTQHFGNTPFASKNPQVYNGSGHNGIDFGVRVGTPIYSAQTGVVLGTGNTDTSCAGVSYGKWVLIKHNNGLTTLYAHLSVISVEAGQTVSLRQKIGLSGNTGYSTGPHLHFTVYASDSVHISKDGEYKSKVCGTNMIMPLAPRPGYLNPLSYL